MTVAVQTNSSSSTSYAKFIPDSTCVAPCPFPSNKKEPLVSTTRVFEGRLFTALHLLLLHPRPDRASVRKTETSCVCVALIVVIAATSNFRKDVLFDPSLLATKERQRSNIQKGTAQRGTVARSPGMRMIPTENSTSIAKMLMAQTDIVFEEEGYSLEIERIL